MSGRVETLLFEDDGAIPNSHLPVLLYRAVLDGAATARFERLFAGNGWTGSWRGGIFDYHHYHSTAHEVLGVAGGSATVQLGGESGRPVTLEAGDVVVIPAGVGHRRLRSSADFGVVGAYAGGRDWDLLRGVAGERPAADRNIAAVPLPAADPVLGAKGGVISRWTG